MSTTFIDCFVERQWFSGRHCQCLFVFAGVMEGFLITLTGAVHFRCSVWIWNNLGKCVPFTSKHGSSMGVLVPERVPIPNGIHASLSWAPSSSPRCDEVRLPSGRQPHGPSGDKQTCASFQVDPGNSRVQPGQGRAAWPCRKSPLPRRVLLIRCKTRVLPQKLCVWEPESRGWLAVTDVDSPGHWWMSPESRRPRVISKVSVLAQLYAVLLCFLFLVLYHPGNVCSRACFPLSKCLHPSCRVTNKRDP